jgi:hypothetical protein
VLLFVQINNILKLCHLLPGAVAMLRKTNRRSLDFSSGYVTLSVPAPPSTNKYQDPKKLPDFVALMPADKFVDSFSSSKELSEILTLKCRELISEWNALNNKPEMANQRTPLDKLFELFRHTWKRWGKAETSVYELQLSTYGYTSQNMNAERPKKMTLKDIKVCTMPE